MHLEFQNLNALLVSYEKVDSSVQMTLQCNALSDKEVCNRGVACSLLKLGSLEKNIIASLFLSGLHSGTIFVEKMMSYVILGNDRICPFFDKKRPKNIM